MFDSKGKMIEAVVIPLFPLSENEIEDFGLIDCTPSGPEVSVIDDEELSGKSVIEIIGEESKIMFHSSSSYSFLVIHINSNNRFFSIVINVRDDAGKDRIFHLSNRKSTIMILESTCRVPMEIGEGWQRICINLDDMLTRSFGSKLVLCSSVTFGGSCRLAKVFFQTQDYSDPQLPPFLRVADERDRELKT